MLFLSIYSYVEYYHVKLQLVLVHITDIGDSFQTAPWKHINKYQHINFFVPFICLNSQLGVTIGSVMDFKQVY